MDGQTKSVKLVTTNQGDINPIIEIFSNGARLFNAALEGDVSSLRDLRREDPLILSRHYIQKIGCFSQSPLHVAANAGHTEFVREILVHKPELAEEVDQSKGSSPLHLASAKGYLEIVKTLLAKKPNMCFVRDRDGRTPIHVAAIEGHIGVLDELVRAKPQAARERTNDGETVLHLCVKYNQPKAFEYLLNATDDGELLNSKDSDDNTVLHLAVAAKHLEIVQSLLKKEGLEKNAINRNGSTAMDVFIHQNRKDVNDKKINKSLKRANALRAKDTPTPQNTLRVWLEKQRSALMVVASLIATMAFQVGINPPGGVWQDDKLRNFATVDDIGHTAGNSIMSDKDSDRYDLVIISNTVGLVSSLSVILLLISGLPCKRFFVVTLMAILWIAVSATTITYLISVVFLSQERDSTTVSLAVRCSVLTWLSFMVILLLSHAIRTTLKFIKKVIKLLTKMWKKCCAKDTTNRPSPV